MVSSLHDFYSRVVESNSNDKRTSESYFNQPNLDLRVLRLFCQRLVAWRDPGKIRNGTAPIKKDILFEFPRVSLCDQPLTKKPEN